MGRIYARTPNSSCIINHILPYRRLYEVSGGGWLNRCHMHHNYTTAVIRLSPIIAQGNLTRVGVPPAYIAAQSHATHIGFQNPPISRRTLHETPESRSQAYFVIFHRHSVSAGSFSILGRLTTPKTASQPSSHKHKNFIRRHALNATS
jgi:hypothetical protein